MRLPTTQTQIDVNRHLEITESSHKTSTRHSERLLTLVAGIARANPDLTLAQIAMQLEAMYERTPRGGTRWSPSSIKNLLDRTRKLGVLGAEQD